MSNTFFKPFNRGFQPHPLYFELRQASILSIYFFKLRFMFNLRVKINHKNNFSGIC